MTNTTLAEHAERVEHRDGETIQPHHQPTTTQTLFATGQIRLQTLSVYNWGSFNGLHTATIDPNGTLITGDNGAGKSTLVDGLMALLLPAGRATFNVAASQGERNDRSLLSYMRGHFGSVHDGTRTAIKHKRTGTVLSGLHAQYHSEDGTHIILAALFWTTQTGNALSDVNRVYIVGKASISLQAMLNAFTDGHSRGLKRWLKQHTQLQCFDDHFSHYQACYRQLLHMENKNAPALLARALGLKKIDDLTALIRELVLEPGTLKDEARNAVSEFADLVATRNQLLDAKAQCEHLSKLPPIHQSITKADKTYTELIKERDGLPIYIAKLAVQHWQANIARWQQDYALLTDRIKDANQHETDATEQVEQRHADYLQAGGERIDVIKRELTHTQTQLNHVQHRATQYQADTKALGLDTTLDKAIFTQHQQHITQQQQQLHEDTHQAQDKFATVSATLSQRQADERAIQEELTHIKARPDSNIAANYQQLRDELCHALEISPDNCPFIAELLDVKESERQWQGAIERALGGLRTTLLLDENHFSLVTRWLHVRHTGLHVRIQQVMKTDNQKAQPWKRDGYLHKLHWREHPYRTWLQQHLARFDLHCVMTTAELDNTPFSITPSGLIHRERGRAEKKDHIKIDDRRHWYLGFSNKARLKLLEEEQRQLDTKLNDIQTTLTQARDALNTLNQKRQHWDKLHNYQWEEIDVARWQTKLAHLQADIAALESSEGDLAQAKQRWQQAKAHVQAIRTAKEKDIKHAGELANTLEAGVKKCDEAKTLANVELTEAVRERLQARLGKLDASLLEQFTTLTHQHQRTIEHALEQCREQKASLEKSAIRIMASFRSHEKWQVIATDWRCDVASLTDYIEHLQALEQEGLPKLVDTFIARLNKHTTQSLARIRQQLQVARDDIIDKIETINHVLKRTEFREGTYLKLGTRQEHYPHVKAFQQQLSTVLSQVTSDDHEARFQQLQDVIATLEKASQPSTAHTLESLRLLDPRYQLAFHADELTIDTDEVRDVLASSSGKSGGEKEAFAGTIVAASLAYVLTPDGHDKPVYSTVFLDEAFSNTAEAVSRRVLRVFKALHIHVNLITPYKNLNLARESARSLLIIERDITQHDSHLCEVTWEEVDAQLAKHRAQRTQQAAQALGITLTEETEATHAS